MIETRMADIGRKVFYAGSTIERGVITSFNESFVFVRYGSDLHSKATRREDLEYE